MTLFFALTLAFVASAEAHNTQPSPGFILNEPQSALEQALRLKQPLLIHFYGIWCPPCNLLDQNVYRDPRFIQATQGWVKLKVDADRELSWALKEKYNVGGYPTVVLANAEGSELGRIVGYRKPQEFIAFVQKAYSSRDQSFEKLLARAKTGDLEAASLAGKILLERKAFDEALQILPDTKEFAQDRLAAKIGGLEKSEAQGISGAKEKLIAALQQAVAEFPTAPESVAYQAQLAELTQNKSLLKKAAQDAHALSKTPALLVGSEWTPADLLQTAAGYLEELNEEKEAKQLWKKAADQYKKSAANSEDRGAHLELAYCLWKSGNVKEATRIYERFEKLFPEEFTFYYGHGAMLLALKRGVDAERLARKAHEFSYGDNRLRTAGLLAKTLKAQSKDTDARRVIQEAIEAARLPADIEAKMSQGVRTFRYVKALREIEKSLKPAQG
jgi:tetratricopeptide (TPR) repeat protein